MKTFFRSLAAAAACCAALVSAQSFNPEIRISNAPATAAPSLHPNIAAAGNNVFVVWVETVNTGGACTDGQGPYCGDIWFSRSTDNGVTFSPAVNLTPGTNPRNDRLPIIATNAAGSQVHILWSDSATAGQVFYRRSTDSGANFAAEVALSPLDAFYSRPTGVLVDNVGNVHVAWYDSAPSSGAAGQVFYRCSSDGGANFTAVTNITAVDGPTDQEQVRLAQGTDGTLYMLVRSSRGGFPQAGWPPFEQVMYRSQSPAGAGCAVTWLHPPQKVSPGLPNEWANTFGGNFAPGAGNVLHTAYWSDKLGTNLVYRRGQPNGAGWGTPTDISGHGANHLQWDGNVVEHTGFGIAEDAVGKVHVVFGENNHLREGFQAGNLFYRCSNDGGLTWISRTFASAQPETAMPRAAYSNNRFHMVWMDWRDNNTGAEIYYRSVTTGACSLPANNINVSAPSINFGGQSMGTTSPSVPVTVTNSGGVAATVTAVVASAQFGQTNNCPATLNPGASCQVDVTFQPAAAVGAINSTTNVNGTLTIQTSQGNPVVNLSGVGEKSLITHYYRSILRRAPDSGGFAFWQGEATRMVNLGANVNETWYAMAQFFYFSAEYLAFARDNNGFVTDLYFTFFNRAPDSGGLNFWVNEINLGLPREVVLAGFMFSPEFTSFAQGIFGNTAARAEVDMVGDFYRGLLARLPDDGGFNAWVAQFRAAQCQGAGAVYTQVENISSAFANGTEYTSKNRSNAQYVGDLYNSFLRRGGDRAGVDFWVNQLNTFQMTRNVVRQNFIASPEFQGRVTNVVNQGCLP